MNIHRAC